MSKRRGEIPHRRLDSEEKRQGLRERYAKFAVVVLQEVRRIDPQAPNDIVTFGENWYQLIELRSFPKNPQEMAIAQAAAQLNQASFFFDSWPIYKRTGQYDIFQLLLALDEGVRAGSLNPRVLKRLAVLDLTKRNSPVNDSMLHGLQDTTWGVNGVPHGTETLVYHITSGYSRQIIRRVASSETDGFNADLHLLGKKKLL